MTIVVIAIVCILLPRLRTRQIAGILAAAVAAFTLAWTGTTEIYAAHGEQPLLRAALRDAAEAPELARQRHAGPVGDLPRPIDQGSESRSTYSSSGTARSRRSGLSTAPLPGRARPSTPNIDRPDGTLTDPGTVYVLATPGVDIVGQRVQPSAVTPVKLGPDRLRLRTAQTGIYPDGWMGREADFTVYDVPPGATGHVTVTLSREAWCGTDVRGDGPRPGGSCRHQRDEPSAHDQDVTNEATGVIHSCQVKTFVLPTPPVGWRVEVTIDPTFVPRELDPTLGDARALGARVVFAYRLEPA